VRKTAEVCFGVCERVRAEVPAPCARNVCPETRSQGHPIQAHGCARRACGERGAKVTPFDLSSDDRERTSESSLLTAASEAAVTSSKSFP
jgi:hypothetical protein